MSKTTNNQTPAEEIVESTEIVVEADSVEIEPEKPYTFRKLSSDDFFLMVSILGKIGIKELKNCFQGESLESVLASFRGSGDDEKALVAVGVAVGFDAVDVILRNLPKCKNEIYALLAQVSGMTEDEIRKDMILFTEMLVDFVKKEEFPDFIKVVSKLFK
jgi:hypothetical protein